MVELDGIPEDDPGTARDREDFSSSSPTAVAAPRQSGLCLAQS